ncbi:S-layer homology domain-containing protein [Pelotomaculum terephthalicicum JT]|uniref:S-layer homology domain-containing protein n=1 Tax=Pelotomaculum terephthalicicum TaxID=206393 RepID=UPI0009CA3C0F|nr:S-layer homology domain-containing protein [Pelotomaculum terephthalicicum]MCG9968815.1 S-layer homology domain-containing protein [Pelotomaculum terephthalicicum JT]OPY63468.1 MAG: Endo-1,4-beta-xylanase A precursor [Pelotomaculum sp. PtaU1.Bin065]
MKKAICAILAAIILLAAHAQVVFADQSITVVTNGGRKTYSPGYIMAVAGRVTNDGEATRNADVFLEIYPAGSPNSIKYYAGTKSNESGYYMTVFTVPSDFSDGDYTIAAHTAEASAESDFSMPSDAPKEVAFLGSDPEGVTETPTEVIPVSTNALALAFQGNVNYFINNKDMPGVVIGANENNEDCISLYKGEDNTPVSFDVELIDDLAAGSATISYYDLSETQLQTQRQCCLVLSLNEQLEENTLYAVKIDGDLCANNGSKLGEDITVYFKTGDSTTSTSTPGGTSGGSSLPAAIPASDLGKTVQNGNITTLQVDTEKASAILKKADMSALVVDISEIAAAGAQKAGRFPAAVVDLAIAEHKPIVLQDSEIIMYIPPEALTKGKEMTFSVMLASDETVQNAPGDTERKAVYIFSASSGVTELHNFQQAVMMTLPIPEDVSAPDKLGVYCLNEENNQWEYMGGRVRDGKLVFSARHFSTFMVAESRKTFADIASHWAKRDIEIMAARQIVSGVGSDEFAPDTKISRAQFAALICRTLNLADNAAADLFNDVPATAWYADDVLKAAKAGLVVGADGKFRPDDMITRQEMAAMIQRAYNYAGGQAPELKEITFSDKRSIDAWAYEAVRTVYSLGIINGRTDGSFGAADNATRAEGAVMLKNMMDKLGL